MRDPGFSHRFVDMREIDREKDHFLVLLLAREPVPEN
jgi:hypothetical protein